jgi:nitrogen regulatory protein P-II 1
MRAAADTCRRPFLLVKNIMKKIECFVRESSVQALVGALAKIGVGGVSVYPVQGFGKQHGKGKDLLMPKMKVEVYTLDMETERIVNTISKIARQGKFGDGKIAILPVDDVIRIRTGEKGAKAVF